MRAILLSFLVVSLVHGSLIFPPPTNGKWGTDIKDLKLIDHNRTDPYDPNGQPRRLMISIVYPTVAIRACNPNNTIPYAPKAVLDVLVTAFEILGVTNITDKVHQLAIPTCPSQKRRTSSSFPILLFSPGLHGSRFLSLSQAQTIASKGYNIILLDHTYDTAIVEFPDGDIIEKRNFTTVEKLDELVRVRAGDVSFVIDQIKNPKSSVGQSLSLDEDCEIGMFGHSLGGATAILASYLDSRIKAIVDLDGYPYGFNTTGTWEDPVFNLPPGLDTPALLFTNSTTPLGPIWDSFTGWKKRLALRGGTHASFTDLPLLVDVLELREKLSEGFLETIAGEIEGVRARDAVGAYVGAFFARFLKGEDNGGLLDGEVEGKWPEVVFVDE